jgi:RNA polymerase sigma-32 factor
MNTKTINTNLPAIAGEGSLSGYLTRIKKFPMLSSEEEYMLAKSWRDRGDLKSAQKLVTSHLRLVAKIAMGYRGYGLPVSELVSEGNIGLMQAVKKFDPERGFKLATYAMWWIKASIQEYILRSWSLVKIGTTTAQKKLFFNLKKLKNKLSAETTGDLHPKHVDEISKRLNVKKEEVVSMDRRLQGKEKSLNDPINDEDGQEWQDWLVDNNLDQELKLSQDQELSERRNLMNASINISFSLGFKISIEIFINFFLSLSS